VLKIEIGLLQQLNSTMDLYVYTLFFAKEQQ